MQGFGRGKGIRVISLTGDRGLHYLRFTSYLRNGPQYIIYVACVARAETGCCGSCDLLGGLEGGEVGRPKQQELLLCQ